MVTITKDLIIRDMYLMLQSLREKSETETKCMSLMLTVNGDSHGEIGLGRKPLSVESQELSHDRDSDNTCNSLLFGMLVVGFVIGG